MWCFLVTKSLAKINSESNTAGIWCMKWYDIFFSEKLKQSGLYRKWEIIAPATSFSDFGYYAFKSSSVFSWALVYIWNLSQNWASQTVGELKLRLHLHWTIIAKRTLCCDFQVSLVLNNTHEFVIFPSASGLGRMHSQVMQASDTERTGRHVSYSTMGIINRMGNMCQWVSLEMRTAVTASQGYLLFYLLSLIVTIVLFWCCTFATPVLCALVCVPLLRLTASRSLGLSIVHVWVCALHRSRLVSSNVEFCTEVRANGFLQGRNIQQPRKDRADTTTSEDRVWWLQHTY